MTVLVCTANTTPQDGGSLYAAHDTHDSTGHVDASAVQVDPTNNYGVTDEVFAGYYNTGDEGKGFMRFDMSLLPASQTITSAHLQVNISSLDGVVSATTGVFAMLTAWDEGTGNATASGDGATWNTSDGSTSWDLESATHRSLTALDSASSGTTTNVWLDFDVTSWVQDITDSVLTNNGLLVENTVGGGAGTNQFLNFVSSEGADGRRPELWIEYTAASGGGAASLIGSNLIG